MNYELAGNLQLGILGQDWWSFLEAAFRQGVVINIIITQ